MPSSLDYRNPIDRYTHGIKPPTTPTATFDDGSVDRELARAMSREIRPVTVHSWRRGADSDLFHFYTDHGKLACNPVWSLSAGEVAVEGDPLCEQCVRVTQDMFRVRR